MIAIAMKLRLNTKLDIQVSEIAEGHLCAVIDDFLLNPGDAKDFACANADDFVTQERAYPGCVLPVGDEPLAELYGFIRREMSRVFAFCRGGILEERFRMFRDPPCYMTESNEAADLLDVVPARFNRLVFYPGGLPHNAHVRHPERLSADLATGRLTLNRFVSALPKG
jgi:hypothetical protein